MPEAVHYRIAYYTLEVMGIQDGLEHSFKRRRIGDVSSPSPAAAESEQSHDNGWEGNMSGARSELDLNEIGGSGDALQRSFSDSSDRGVLWSPAMPVEPSLDLDTADDSGLHLLPMVPSFSHSPTSYLFSSAYSPPPPLLTPDGSPFSFLAESPFDLEDFLE